MATEIERKFLLENDSWRSAVSSSKRMTQAYLVSALAEDSRSSVRIRITGEQADINIKSAELGIHRTEFEYSIPLQDAQQMIDSLCHRPIIDKTRHSVPFGDHHWEIDEFHGENSGLTVAEIELKSAREDFKKPAWLGQEVSDDPRYYNTSLVNAPYKSWT